MIPQRRFESRAQGPHLLVFGAIHGNEVCGPRALKRLITALESREIQLLRGTLTRIHSQSTGLRRKQTIH